MGNAPGLFIGVGDKLIHRGICCRRVPWRKCSLLLHAQRQVPNNTDLVFVQKGVVQRARTLVPKQAIKKKCKHQWFGARAWFFRLAGLMRNDACGVPKHAANRGGQLYWDRATLQPDKDVPTHL